ncbi:response regulator [Sulfurimonas sp. C5]|uniref:response regulator n=1 Tax=Sulfurimonas sp. C5 TaxID=3036947 RepID=UPI00245497B8|nr:response regulator [Sulfurimonas sp. C5]MDH4943596.1 response regulator [Sulfurimonas sp. C5]
MGEINLVKLKKYASLCSVLYVEDDKYTREKTETFLKKFFNDIVVAQDGEDALEKYKSRDYDIIITDLFLPQIDGLELISFIKEKNNEQHVVVTSAYVDSEILMKLVNLNIDKFVEKPFKNKQFLFVLYRVSKSIYSFKQKKILQDELENLSKNAQIIIDATPIGIVTIQNNEVQMVNKAFLEIGGFDSFETLQIEMPDIGMLFDDAQECINAQTNEEFIHQMLTFPENKKQVRILNDLNTKEYKVTISELEGENGYVLTFTDITAIHNALYTHSYTHIPNKNFLIEKIDLLRKSNSSLYMILLTVKNFQNIEKWYGVKEAKHVEVEFSNLVQKSTKKVDIKYFIGYFEQNQLVIIPDQSDLKNIQKLMNSLRDLRISNVDLSQNHFSSATDFSLNILQKLVKVSDEEITDIEATLLNEFELL